jgi:hypothetical protein
VNRKKTDSTKYIAIIEDVFVIFLPVVFAKELRDVQTFLGEVYSQANGRVAYRLCGSESSAFLCISIMQKKKRIINLLNEKNKVSNISNGINASCRDH